MVPCEKGVQEGKIYIEKRRQFLNGNYAKNFSTSLKNKTKMGSVCLISLTEKVFLKVGYNLYENKAFVYISVFKILNFIRQLFIFSCLYSIINDQDTTIRFCENIK